MHITSIVVLFSFLFARSRCGRTLGQRIKSISFNSLTLFMFSSQSWFFSFPTSNRIDFNHYVFHFILPAPHTHMYTHNGWHICAWVYVCVLCMCSCSCVCTHHTYSRFRPPHTTRLLIYRCLYMFALAAAVGVDVDVAFSYLWNTFTFPYAMPFACHFQHIQFITWRTPFTAIFRSKSEWVTSFRLQLVCYFFYIYDSISWTFRNTIMINRTLRKINRYGNVQSLNTKVIKWSKEKWKGKTKHTQLIEVQKLSMKFAWVGVRFCDVFHDWMRQQMHLQTDSYRRYTVNAKLQNSTSKWNLQSKPNEQKMEEKVKQFVYTIVNWPFVIVLVELMMSVQIFICVHIFQIECVSLYLFIIMWHSRNTLFFLPELNWY